MNCEHIYQNIKNGCELAEELQYSEKTALFSYLCSVIEQGGEVEESLIDLCACAVDTANVPPAEKVMEKVYKKSIFKKVKHRFPLKRVAVACAAVFVSIGLFVGTASAFGLNIVEELRCVVTDDHVVKFEEYNAFLHKTVTSNYSYNRLFEKRLEGLMYPQAFPEDAVPVKVKQNTQSDGRLYTLYLEPSSGENWQIYAKPESESYLPMGYKFKVDYGNAVLEYVYTVSRSSDGITGYKLYTVYDGVMYTFDIKDPDWTNVKIILENLVIK